jgi:4-amino-4-deoxy-L-arabinose transferase-like glycosyltransferase
LSSPAEQPGSESSPTFAESILGPGFLSEPWRKRLSGLPATWRIAGAMAAFAALVLVPYLGAVGLWDPWETHYGEVARSMVQRRDYVYPFWENAWFFSKPAFTMWLMALGMLVVGTNRTEGAVALYTEWGMRLPFALFSIAAVTLLALAVSRTAGRRAGLAAGFALVTMPMYFLISRQAMTDTPFVTAMTCALACAIIGQLDATTRHRAGWWYAFYVFIGMATLAKGLLGVGLPAVILALYALVSVVPYEREALADHGRWLASPAFRAEVDRGKRPMPTLWGQLYKMKLGTGLVVFAAVAVPWYLVMSLFEGVDDESKRFFTRFFIHDHVARLTSGVHTTTPGGNFAYFIDQGGYALFPWVGALPAALIAGAQVRARGGTTTDHLLVIAWVWVAFTFALIGFSATKFHHYLFPTLPALAILIGVFADRLWREGIRPHWVGLLLGLVLFGLVAKDLAGEIRFLVNDRQTLLPGLKSYTNLFTYNYSRDYPVELVTRNLSLFGMRPLWVGDLLGAALLTSGGYLAFDAFADKSRPVYARAFSVLLALCGLAILLAMGTRGRATPALFLGLSALLAAIYLGNEAMREKERRGEWAWVAGGLAVAGLLLAGLGLKGGRDPFLAEFIRAVNLKVALGFACGAAGALLGLALLSRSKLMLFGTFWAFAAGFALWFNWNHWVDLSHHWTQRDVFWRYYEQRKPGEPIAAFLMNWRGETFYSRNTVKQIKDNGRLAQYAAQPGREWAMVEQYRLGILKSAVGPDKVVTTIDKDLNNKFVLVTIE